MIPKIGERLLDKLEKGRWSDKTRGLHGAGVRLECFETLVLLLVFTKIKFKKKEIYNLQIFDKTKTPGRLFFILLCNS